MATPYRRRSRKAARPVDDLPPATTFYRGGGEGSMPRNMTARDVLAYETEELGNSIAIEPIDLDAIPSERLLWLTETRADAREYGPVEKITLSNYRIVARDRYGGVLVECL